MAPLTSARRNALPSTAFALPGRRYPLDTPNRARNALARISQHGTTAEQAVVRRKVAARYPTISVSGVIRRAARG